MPCVLDALAANVPLKDGAYIAVVLSLSRSCLRTGSTVVRPSASRSRLSKAPVKAAWPRSSFSSGAPSFSRLASTTTLSSFAGPVAAGFLASSTPVPSWHDLIEACRGSPRSASELSSPIWQKIWNGNLKLRLSNVKVLANG